MAEDAGEHEEGGEEQGYEQGEGELPCVAAQAEALQGEAEAGEVDVEHLEEPKERCRCMGHRNLVHAGDAGGDLVEAEQLLRLGSECALGRQPR